MSDQTNWDGPFVGQLGVLVNDGERAQCHMCGRFFGNLGGHVSQAHGLKPDEYKERFGLNATTGLIGPALHQARVSQGKARVETPEFEKFVAAGVAARSRSDAVRRPTKGRRLRLQQRLDPRVRAARLASLARANEVLNQRKAAGLHQPHGWGSRDPREVAALGHQRLRQLRRDPEWRQKFAERVSAGRGGRLTVTCRVCGKSFREPLSHRQRKTCGPDCLEQLRRQHAAARIAANEADRRARLERGKELGRQRQMIGASVSDLARAVHRSPSHLSRVERGLNVPSEQTIAAIRSALDGLARTVSGRGHRVMAGRQESLSARR